MPEKIEKPPREDLVDCKEENMTLEEIAAIYTVSVSTVKRWIREYGLTAKKKAKLVMTEKYARPNETVLDKAKSVLGSRLTEHRIRGYILDGRPMKTDDVIRAAGLQPKAVD